MHIYTFSSTAFAPHYSEKQNPTDHHAPPYQPAIRASQLNQQCFFHYASPRPVDM